MNGKPMTVGDLLGAVEAVQDAFPDEDVLAWRVLVGSATMGDDAVGVRVARYSSGPALVVRFLDEGEAA